MSAHLIAPHGGTLVDLFAAPDRAADLSSASRDWPSHDLTPRQLCDLELLLDGGFSPLTGFMTSRDHAAVCAGMRLDDGTLWPIPITLDVGEALADKLSAVDRLALRDQEGVMLAVLHVEDVWRPDHGAEARGGVRHRRPGASRRRPPPRPHRAGLRRGPGRGRAAGAALRLQAVAAHPGRAARRFRQAGVDPGGGVPDPQPHAPRAPRADPPRGKGGRGGPADSPRRGDDAARRRRPLHAGAVLPGAAAPLSAAHRDALAAAAGDAHGGAAARPVWHAIIRKNHGCTHLIVGRDHAGPGRDSGGTPFYGPYDAQELLAAHEAELGVAMVPFKMMVYVEDTGSYLPVDEVPEGRRTLSLSGTELRGHLAAGRDIPSWFTFPAVADELARSHPPRRRQGFTLLFTGLSGSGKSTIANVLLVKLLERGGAPRDPARRRPRAQEPVVGARLLARAPRHQHPAHRLRGVGDHQETAASPSARPSPPTTRCARRCGR